MISETRTSTPAALESPPDPTWAGALMCRMQAGPGTCAGRPPLPPGRLRRVVGPARAGPPRRPGTHGRPAAAARGRRVGLRPDVRRVRGGGHRPRRGHGRHVVRMVVAEDDPDAPPLAGEDDPLLARPLRREELPGQERPAHGRGTSASFAQHALGRFQPLLSAVLQDPAVRLSFDANANRKTTLDLALARALLERFSVGAGVATERDVRETARALTGLAVLRNQSRFLAQRARRRLEGRSGAPATGPRLTSCGLPRPIPRQSRLLARRMLSLVRLGDRRAGRRVCSRRWPMPSPAMATWAGWSGWSSAPTCSSRLRPIAAGSRAPWNSRLGLVIGLEGLVPTSRLAGDLAALGQNLGEPPTAAGWAGGTAWINPATLVGRANLASSLLSGSGSYGAGLDPQTAADAHGRGAPPRLAAG